MNCSFQYQISKYIFLSRYATYILEKAQKSSISLQEIKIFKNLLMLTLMLLEMTLKKVVNVR